MAKGKRTGGRQRGTLNKSTAAVKAYAQQFTGEAVDCLVAIMRNRKAPFPAQVAAAREILDRGYGKPTQALSDDKGGPLTPVRVIHVHHPVRQPLEADEATGSAP